MLLAFQKFSICFFRLLYPYFDISKSRLTCLLSDCSWGRIGFGFSGFFTTYFFFDLAFTKHGLAWKGGEPILTRSFHFHPLHEHLNINREITAKT